MIPLATDEIIETKAQLVLRGYPTQGVTMSDLVDITIELCHDDGYRPRAAQVRRVIQAMNLPHLGCRYFQSSKIDLAPEAPFVRRAILRPIRGESVVSTVLEA